MLADPEAAAQLEVFVGEIDPGGSTGAEQYAHGDSEELFVVLSGKVRLELGDGVHELETGDSIGYWSSTPTASRTPATTWRR